MLNTLRCLFYIISTLAICSCSLPYDKSVTTRVVARHIDMFGGELSRVEQEYACEKRKYFFSPEGPSEIIDTIGSIYLFDKGGGYKIEELSGKKSEQLRLYNYFPLTEGGSWVVLSFFESTYQKDCVSLSVIEFGKSGVLKRNVIPDCLVEHGQVRWKFVDYVLYFATKSGVISYDLNTKEITHDSIDCDIDTITAISLNKGTGGIGGSTTIYR